MTVPHMMQTHPHIRLKKVKPSFGVLGVQGQINPFIITLITNFE